MAWLLFLRGVLKSPVFWRVFPYLLLLAMGIATYVISRNKADLRRESEAKTVIIQGQQEVIIGLKEALQNQLDADSINHSQLYHGHPAVDELRSNRKAVGLD